jgi:hypothetical protein
LRPATIRASLAAAVPMIAAWRRRPCINNEDWDVVEVCPACGGRMVIKKSIWGASLSMHCDEPFCVHIQESK